MITLMVSTIIPVVVRKEIKERKKKQEQIPQKKLLLRQKAQRDMSDAYI